MPQKVLMHRNVGVAGGNGGCGKDVLVSVGYFDKMP